MTEEFLLEMPVGKLLLVKKQRPNLKCTLFLGSIHALTRYIRLNMSDLLPVLHTYQ